MPYYLVMGDETDAGGTAHSDPRPSLPRALAFYVPRFHPIAQNDALLGRGFTDWARVTQARPLFPGHHQPHVPGELGFYDLRLPEVRQAQVDLAATHGISGFVYDHYWYGGSRPYGRPFDEVLATGTPSFPFALNWVNEPWTTGGIGRNGEVVLADRYSREDDLAHVRWLAGAFGDDRYITIDGRPLVLVSAPLSLPDPKRTFELWRTEAQRLGFPDLYLCYLERHGPPPRGPGAFGMDASVQHLPTVDRDDRVYLPVDGARGNRIIDYPSAVARRLGQEAPTWRQFPSVATGWDDTPWRPLGASVFDGATPDVYQDWLATIVDRCGEVRAEENYLFLLSWNDWADGSHLEPDQRFGRAWLDATREALVAGGPARDDGTDGPPGEQVPARVPAVPVHEPPPGGTVEPGIVQAVGLVDYLVQDRPATVVHLGPGPDRVREHLAGRGLATHPIGSFGEPASNPIGRHLEATPHVPTDVAILEASLGGVDGVGAFLVHDLLEHLVDPQLLLASLSEWSLGHGRPVLVVCVPNVSHFDVALRLLCGRWVPTGSGPPDGTCVRFFAQETLERLLERTGWVIVARDDVSAVRSDQYEFRLNDALPVEMIGALRTLSQAENSDATVQTFVWALRPVPVQEYPRSYLDAVRTPDDALDPGPSSDLRSLVDFFDAAGLLASEANQRAVERAALLDALTGDDPGAGRGLPGSPAWKERVRREAARSPRRGALLTWVESWMR